MNKQIVISDAVARRIYPSAAPELKAILENTYNKEFFSQEITDRIKTVEDAYEALNRVRSYPEGLTEFEVYMRDAMVIIEALNEGWKPNWDDSSERKWRPWFYLDSPGGFRFHGSHFVFVYSYSAGGSRLCLKSEKLCNYFAKQFLPLCKVIYS